MTSDALSCNLILRFLKHFKFQADIMSLDARGTILRNVRYFAGKNTGRANVKAGFSHLYS